MKVLFALFTAVLFSHSFFAQEDCSLGLLYYQDIEVSFSSGSGGQVANTYAIPFYGKALFDAGKIQANGGDLRITDALCNPLPFYTQGFSERDTNVIYVALPAMEETGMTIRLHYGSSTEQTGVMSGEEVFIWFDDFEDGIVDEVAWEAVGSYTTFSEVDGSLFYQGNFTSGGGIYQYVSPREGYTEPVTFDFTASVSNQEHYGLANLDGLNRLGYRYGTGFSADTLDIIAQFSDTINGGFSNTTYPNIGVNKNVLNVISVSAYVTQDSAVAMTRFQNLSNQQSNLDTVITDTYAYSGLRPFFSSLNTTEVEYVGVRNTPAVLPQTLASDEVVNPVSSVGAIQLQEDQLRLSPNPCASTLRLIMNHPALSSGATISIYDINGRLLIEREWTSQLDLSHLSEGMYSLLVVTKTGAFSSKRLMIAR